MTTAYCLAYLLLPLFFLVLGLTTRWSVSTFRVSLPMPKGGMPDMRKAIGR
jgi:hypothetical protein